MSAWIRVTDKLPENNGMYIVAVADKEHLNKAPDVTAAFFEDGEFVHIENHSFYDRRLFVTHWDYFPSTPCDYYY